MRRIGGLIAGIQLREKLGVDDFIVCYILLTRRVLTGKKKRRFTNEKTK